MEELKVQLNTERQRIKQQIEQLYKKSNNFYGQSNAEKNLSIVVYEFLLQFLRKAMGGQRKYSTFRKWIVTKNKIQSFCWYHYNCSIFPLEKITYAFAQNFYDYLTLVDNAGNNLAMKYIKNVKQIFDRAVNNGWLLKNPIHGFKCNYIDTEPEPVVMEDILKLINTDLGAKLNEYKDTFLFGIFTGFAYAELKDLDVNDIYTGIDGKKWIRNVRDKTQTKERVPLLPLPLQIIEKYNNHPCRIIERKLLPVYSNQYYNKHLKIIAQKCNIGVDLTSHIARYTFATVITLENDVPLSTVGKMLGHKTTRTTERYARATQKKISKNMSRLENDLFYNAIPENANANIYISCVDTVQARFEIAAIINEVAKTVHYRIDEPLYWLDCGNSQYTGQVVLATAKEIKQPTSEKYKPVGILPSITYEYKNLLKRSEREDTTPSCSLAETLNKQDLFINSTLAQMGCSLLWNLFRFGMTENRGFFLNLQNFMSRPLKVA